MKLLLGILLILGGIALGLYVGIYLMFVQGIIGLVYCVQHTDIATGSQWAWAIVRIFPLAELLGWVSAVVLILPGVVLVSQD